MKRTILLPAIATILLVSCNGNKTEQKEPPKTDSVALKIKQAGETIDSSIKAISLKPTLTKEDSATLEDLKISKSSNEILAQSYQTMSQSDAKADQFTEKFIEDGNLKDEMINRLKRSLNDPSSFQYDTLSVYYSVFDSIYTVTIRYRAKNAFNATVLQYVYIKVNEKGEIQSLETRQ